MAKTKRTCLYELPTGNLCGRTPPQGEAYCNLHNEDAQAEIASKKADYLTALSQVLTHTVAAERAGIGSTTIDRWRIEDPMFDADCERAQAGMLDKIETAMAARAIGQTYVERTYEPDPNNPGETVLVKEVHKRVYDTRAAEIILRGYRPQFRNNWNEPPPSPRDVEADDAAKQLLEDPELAAAMDELLDSVDLDE